MPGRGRPGSGAIVWRDVLDTLLTGGYRGWIGAEYAPAADEQGDPAWWTTLQETREEGALS